MNEITGQAKFREGRQILLDKYFPMCYMKGQAVEKKVERHHVSIKTKCIPG